MLVLPLVAGTLTLLTLVVGAAAVRNLPVRWACPDCHHATSPVRRALTRPVSFLIQWRWCPRCHWSGWSRPRPAEVEAQPLAPRTAFQWGEGERRAPRRRWVFKWKGDAEEKKTPVRKEPAHASGFRWGASSTPARSSKPRPEPRPKADPRPQPEPRPQPKPAPRVHPSGFQWADDDAAEAPGFRWKDDESSPAEALVALLKRVGGSADHPSGFRWGDAPEDREADFAWARSDESDTFGFRWND